MKTGRTLQSTALILALVFSFGVAAPAALAGGEAPDMAVEEVKEYNDSAMVFDALVLRPMGAVATVFGAAVWVVFLPVTIISGDVERTGSKFVADPLRYTFKRPLGDI
jgi:hypothetical protein